MPLYFGTSTTPIYGVFVSEVPADTNIVPLASPSISINTSTGVITSTVNQTTAGYVDISTTTSTLPLTTQAGVTITPTNAIQTAVAAQRYTTGVIRVAAVPTETATFTNNGTYNPTSGKWFSQVTVNVPIGSTIKNQNKTVTPSETTQYISCDVDSNNYTGLGTVTVNGITATYVGSNINRLSSSDLIGEVYDLVNYKVTAPAGYYAQNAEFRILKADFGSTKTLNIQPTISINQNGLISVSGGNFQSFGAETSGYLVAGFGGVGVNAQASNTKQLETQAGITITPTTSSQTAVTAGKYTTGAIMVAGDSNLVPSNIKNGVTIFGTTGTYGGGASATFGTLTITANNSYLASSYGYDGFSSVNVNVPDDTFTVTLSWNDNTGQWIPVQSFTSIQTAYNSGKNIIVNMNEVPEMASADGKWDNDNSRFNYWTRQFVEETNNIKIIEQCYNLTSSGLEKSNEYIYYDTSGADAISSDVTSGQIFYNANGYQVGTMTASGGITPTGNLSITANGANINVSQYATVTVDVPTSNMSVQVEQLSGGGEHYIISGSPAISTDTYRTLQSNEAISVGSNYNGYIEIAKKPELIYDWDFTNGLVDSIGGLSVTLANGATRDSNGITISDASQYAVFPISYAAHMTYELDIASANKGFSGTHGRLLMVSQSEGFIANGGNTWQAYLNGMWSGSFGSLSNVSLNNKTLRIESKQQIPTLLNGTSKMILPMTISLDNVEWAKTPNGQIPNSSNRIMIGSSGAQSFYNLVVTGFRVYNGVDY